MFQPELQCPTTYSSAYSDCNIKVFLAVNDVFFCSSCVAQVSFSDELGVCTVTGYFLAPEAGVTPCIDTRFDTPSLSITSVYRCSWITQNDPAFLGCNLLHQSCNIIVPVLELPIDGGVPTNTNRLDTDPRLMCILAL